MPMNEEAYDYVSTECDYESLKDGSVPLFNEIVGDFISDAESAHFSCNYSWITLASLSGGFKRVVLYKTAVTQSFNIPDGISFDHLQELLNNAPADCPPEDTEGAKDAHFEHLCDIALRQIEIDDVDSGSDVCQIHKLMLCELVSRMVIFHKSVSSHAIEDGNNDVSIAWAADAGKFQAIMNILQTINCGPDDRTCVQN